MASGFPTKLWHTLQNQWAWWWEASNGHGELAPARSVLTISILILLIFYLWASLTPRSVTFPPKPPGPRGFPIVGYLPFLGPNLHHTFAKLTHRYGPIFKLELGQKLCVVISSSTLAEEVVRHQDVIFSDHDANIAASIASYGGHDIAFGPYGPEWRAMRKLFVRQMLSQSSLEACYHLRRNEVRKTVRKLREAAGAAVDIGLVTFETQINIVMSMIWGGTLAGTEEKRVGSEFRAASGKLMELMGKPNVSDFFPGLARFDLQGVERETKRQMTYIGEILDSVVDARVKMGEVEKKGKVDFLQILLELKEQEATEVRLTHKHVKGILMDIVVGGTDTTATTVEWVMAELVQHPEVMNKAQVELSDVVGMDQIVEEFHIPKLHYLEAVIKETLRLHPPLPLLVPRRPNKSTLVGGYTIPKDTKVFLNAWAMHRDPQFWADPSEFKPERFLSRPDRWGYAGNNFQFLPFGSGRRVCVGIPLAEKMVMYLLASFLHSFNWHLPEGEELDLTEKFGIVMKKSKPLIALPTQRLPDSQLYA